MEIEAPHAELSENKKVRASTKQNIASDFIIKNKILPRPPENMTKWKETYLNEAKSMWKQRQVNEREDTR